ncbi:MAG TPA: alpha-ketoacid dehydrogenase subunit beta [Candidatus Methylomirabilis sp.]|nr:alpha-ketoacid dehydrogenase subunit beta [Candidatus Methylomirabilis sp.]
MTIGQVQGAAGAVPVGTTRREITYAEAIAETLRAEMRLDPRVFVMGEDVGLFGGLFGGTKGLLDEFGPERVRDTPISEAALIGAGIGAALTGMRPMVEIQFMDFTACAMDQIVNQAAKIRFMLGGKANVPLVIRTPYGTGLKLASQHSQSLEAWFVHTPGLLVAMPSTPADAKGLLVTALRDPNPVIFLEHKLLYPTRGPVSEEQYTIPFGSADVKRPGKDVTVVATGLMVSKSLTAAAALAAEGIEAEVVDPRTLVPLDKGTIIESVKKTGRLVVVHEAVKRGGFGGEVAGIIAEEAFDYLDAPIKRVAGKNVPIAFNEVLEKRAVPDVEDIVSAVRSLVG